MAHKAPPCFCIFRLLSFSSHMDPTAPTSNLETPTTETAHQPPADNTEEGNEGSTDAGAGSDEAAGTAPAGPPVEGSDAWASLEFGRNLTRLREARNFTQAYLAAVADVPIDSIRGYEAGANRPKQPFLLKLAQALGVMPISIGPGFTRKGVAPVATEIQLKQKSNRALRVQHLVVLLAQGQATDFAALVKMTVPDLYALASTEAQLTDAQLDPLLNELPQVRRSWLMSGGEGEPLDATRAPAAPPVPPAGVPAAPEAAPAGPAPEVASVPTPVPVPRPQPIVGAPAGVPLHYVPLSGGLVAEVATVEGVITHVRFLAGAGAIPGLTSPAQLDGLHEALHGLLPSA